MRNHGDQSLEKLATRGGLDPSEALAVLENRRWERIENYNEASARLFGLVYERVQAKGAAR